jgi:magnesium transporter
MKLEQQDLLDRLTEALQDADDVRLAHELAEVRAADIAECFEELHDEDRSRIIFALRPHTAAEVVGLLDEAVRGEVVDELDTESLTEIVSELPPDDAADVLSELTREEGHEILEHMPDEKSEKIEELLAYDENTAGGIMTPDVVAIPAAATVADAVEYVRAASQEEDLHEVYIVDADHKLVGTVPLRRLVTHAPKTRLADICDRDPVTVYVGDDQEAVVQIIRKYDVTEAAVVDLSDRLLGRITHDDLLDVADEEAEEDMYRMAGTDPSERETHSVFHAARIRLMWLLPCMFGMLLTATVLKVSEPQFDLALFAALVLFVPMIAAMGGNSGIQISTVIVRGFATGELSSGRFLRAMFREGRIILAIAPVCGLLAWGLVTIFFPLFQRFLPASSSLADVGRIALAVGTAMAAAILVAGLLGVLLPFTFRRLSIDPAIASGPLITTMNDVLSVAIYMTLATAIAQ